MTASLRWGSGYYATVPDLDTISDHTYVEAGADFAFVLTRRGRLISRHAPQEMPQEGRSRIVEAALSLAEGARFGHLELPREDLVPYGGAAPVDVYFGAAAEMILCVVIPTWAAKEGAIPALEAGLRALEEIGQKDARPARKRRSAVAGLASLAAGPPTRSRARPSLPDIRVGVASVGRETLVAIEADAREHARPGSAPDAVRVDLVSISRESLADIAAAESRQATAGPRPSMPLIRPDRLTQPYVESAEAGKRAAQAAAQARKAAPPELTLEIVEPDTEVFEAALADRAPAERSAR